ncbi:MAG: phospho-sugar mutase [Verrucomicrobia bacterium]|nr:phospho-sugar mutase [Verrucomicrobiota bacterium]MBV8376767.1 phospho-sugar mutase [Verrucomicrobiota bacterium]
MSDLREILEHAAGEERLPATSVANILQLLSGGNNPVYTAAIEELAENKAWTELNDRFYKTLSFGTGGLRGRTIGKIVTRAEAGREVGSVCPEFPCVGTNAMNFYNISRATQGLVRYIKEYLARKDPAGTPSLAIAHDTRFFSRQFAQLAAKVAVENGCNVFLFESSRSTPELSFAVRHTNSTAGIVITASHNPLHDNGYKVYFSDGGQVVEPHASAIIGHVNAILSEHYLPLPKSEQSKLTVLGEDLDEVYKARLRTLILRPELVSNPSGVKIVFTAIHGAGGIISVPVLRDLGFNVTTVTEQDRPDGSFPTVKSPNPENSDALAMAIALAEGERADLVIGTDPDADRLGVAFRDRSGKMQLVSGNQIGSLLAFYRIGALKKRGILNDGNKHRAVIIKTVVTTDLQKSIAQREGVRCVETLTGFKYIGAKLAKYEAALPEEIRNSYRSLFEEETRSARLQNSSFYVFGGEESYGYSGADFVRDKDGNGAAIMFAEVAAYAKSTGKTLDQLLDQIYLEYGCYLEKSGFLIFEGAEGAGKIRRLVDSYYAQPPKEIDGSEVVKADDYSAGGIYDVEGDVLPKERMTIFQLADERRVAVRPSGTEPKIKFYLFGKSSKVSADSLDKVKADLAAGLESLWAWLQEDAKQRAG